MGTITKSMVLKAAKARGVKGATKANPTHVKRALQEMLLSIRVDHYVYMGAARAASAGLRELGVGNPAVAAAGRQMLQTYAMISRMEGGDFKNLTPAVESVVKRTIMECLSALRTIR